MSESQQRRPFQFRLMTVMIAVTLLALLCGAIRWLFILAGTEVAVAVLATLSIVIIYVRSFAAGRSLWRKWEGGRDRREEERNDEAMRRLLESPEVKEAIRAAQAERSANSNAGSANPK
jgi:small-conductance mechanosensitive channel